MKKKKITATLLCAVITLSLAGCNKNEGTPDSSPNSTSNTESSDKGESSYSESVNSADESKPAESSSVQSSSESQPEESQPTESKPAQSSSSKPQSSSTKPQSSSSMPQSSSTKPVTPPQPQVLDWSKVPVATDEDFEYKIEGNITDSAAVVKKYIGNNPYVKMPNELGGEKVIRLTNDTEWGSNTAAIMLSDTCTITGFQYKDSMYGIWIEPTTIGMGKNVTKVVVPDSWTKIGFYDLSEYRQGMPNLKEFNFPKNLTIIPSVALRNTKIKSVTIPENIVSIGKEAFEDCNHLTAINFPKKFSSGCTIEWYAFRNCKTLKSVEMPEGIVQLGGGTFFGCTSLTEVTLPSDLKEISNAMFSGCTSLQNIDLPDGLTKIGKEAFRNCTSLKSINIPDSVTYIDRNAFGDISGITVTYKGQTFNEKNVSKLYECDLSKV